MDIIRQVWQPMLEAIDIYHEFNGKKIWYPTKYKEDFLCRHKHMPHFVGALHMLNQGMRHVLGSGKKYDYIIVTSADVWFYDAKKLKDLIFTCHKLQYQLATSLWGITALATEFFIITPDLAKRVFPLSFSRFLNKYELIRWLHTTLPVFESLFTIQVMRILKNPKKLYLIPGRRMVWFKNRFWSPNFYASHHDPVQRKNDILPKIRTLGKRVENMPSLSKFLEVI